MNNYLHFTTNFTGLLEPFPSEFVAMQVYSPAVDLTTFCKTKLWSLRITPPVTF